MHTTANVHMYFRDFENIKNKLGKLLDISCTLSYLIYLLVAWPRKPIQHTEEKEQLVQLSTPFYLNLTSQWSIGTSEKEIFTNANKKYTNFDNGTVENNTNVDKCI